MWMKIVNHNDITIGDIVIIDCGTTSARRAKVEEIYRMNGDVRFIVKTSSGMFIDLHSKYITINKKNCICEIKVLMRAGCQCGGF